MRTFLQQNWLVLVVGIGVLAFAAIHLFWYIKPSDVKSTDDLQQRLNSGQPTVVEYYTNL